ncbi:MAG TPA: DUF2156 domain-containing protein [Blastocatellia bacterium]|nr:DUF2156 domain-containing protein [Blastocatellia bacterium]
MAKVIGSYDTLRQAQEAVRRLVADGIAADCLSILGQDKKHSFVKSGLKKSVFWGGALGAAVSFLLPGGGHLFLAGNLARAAAMHALRITATGMLAGAAAGGTIDVLRRAGLDRRAAHEAAEIIAAGRCALALDGDWVTVQRARRALDTDHWQPEANLAGVVRRHSYEHQSFLSLYPGMSVWSADELDASVVYRRVGSIVVVAAAPLAPRENLTEVTRRFLGFCRGQKLDCLMLPVGPQFAEVAEACGMGLLRIGESGYFRLPTWKPLGDRGKKVRSGVNQARKAGIVVERYDPQKDKSAKKREQIEALCQAWINTREVDALGWLLELNPFVLSEHKRYFLAWNAAGKLEGMLACSPIYARNGWYLEDLIRRPDSERGVSELLVVETLRQLADEGAELATLGTSPLAGVKPGKQFRNLSRLLGLIYEHLDAFYHFKALHRFKSKFAPSFVEPEYIAIYPPRIRLRMIFGVIGAFDPAGLTGVTASKLRRLWREARKREREEP